MYNSTPASKLKAIHRAINILIRYAPHDADQHFYVEGSDVVIKIISEYAVTKTDCARLKTLGFAQDEEGKWRW